MSGLPIEPLLPEILRRLAAGRNLVLEAPPGAGKTTLVPPALLGEDWLAGRRIVMLEPRRLATRAAARRMAALAGEAVGGTIGYRMRLETRIGPATRIEVVTDGILIRMLQEDAALEGVGALVFDEFHERGLDADLGLALALEAQRHLREDLRILVMSATLDGDRVAGLLGGAPVVRSAGRSFPVETSYLGREPGTRIEDAVTAAIRRALREEEGSILAFLPGAGEIRRTERLLAEAELGSSVILAPLYGELPQEAQDSALLPAPPGARKIVLATSIAETSLTIEDIRIVVDGGLARVPRFEPRSGMTRLETVKVSQAAAEQRRGRAGRTAPGICYRLWSEAEQRILPAFAAPEMLAADLAPLALELACWGAEPSALAFLDPPPAAAYAAARALLKRLGAIDAAGRATAEGRSMARLGLHPRLAHMIAEGGRRGEGALACDIAALLSARDLVKAQPGGRDADLQLRLELMAGDGGRDFGLVVDRGLLRQARQQARDWRRRAGIVEGERRIAAAGSLLAAAYPDRIAQRRSGGAGQFLLSGGRGAVLPEADPLAAAEYLAVAELDGDRRAARIFLAAPLTLAEIEAGFAASLETRDIVAWDARTQAVLARRQLRLDALVLREAALADPPPEAVRTALVEGIRAAGLDALPWSRDLRQWQQRVVFLRHVEGPARWPDLSDEALAATLETWLGPRLDGVRRLSQVAPAHLTDALHALLDWERRRTVETLAPSHLTVPSGSRLPIDYSDPEAPSLAVRLQEMLGSGETPRIAGGRMPLRLQLLSPAGRPLQVTSDLAGFWATSYRAVRAEMKGRYPKHPWPEDPLSAVPMSRAKRRAG